MNKIKSAKLLVNYAGCNVGESVHENPQHTGRWHVRGKRITLTTDDLRTLSRHGIVSIVEEEERSCRTCARDSGYETGNRSPECSYCGFPTMTQWQPRPDPVEDVE